MAASDPTIQALINALLAADNSRVQAKAPAKKATSAAKPKIVFSGIPDKSEYNPEPKASGSGKGSGHHTSPFHKLLDYISRPEQAIEVGILHAQKNHGSQASKIGSLLGGMASGFTGHERTTGQQLVENKYGKGNHRGLEGFLVDVALDPLNFVGPGAIKAVGKGIKAIRGGKKVEEAVAASKAVDHVFKNPSSAFNKERSILPEKPPAIEVKAPSKAFSTGRRILPEAPAKANPVATKSFGKAAKRTPVAAEKIVVDTAPGTVPAETVAAIKEAAPHVPAPKLKDIPPPKPVEFKDLPEAFRNEVIQTARSKVPALFDQSELAGRLGRGRRLDWQEISSNPKLLQEVTDHPEFKKWFAGIAKTEADHATAEFNARQLAKHAEFIKKLNATVPTTPAEAVIKAAEGLPKPLPDKKIAIASSALDLHLANHGDQALTPLGQARLRQTVSNEYFKTHPIHIKGNEATVKSINEIYKEAEKQAIDSGAVLSGPRLSDLIDTLPADVVKDPAKLEKAILGGDVKDVARQAAAELPKQAQKPYIRGLLDSLKASGNATEVAQASLPKLADVKFKTFAAVNKDLGLGDVPKLDLVKVQSDKVLQDIADYVSRTTDWIDRRFNAAYGQTSWEHSALRQGENAVNTAKEHDINYLRKLIKGTNKQGFNASFKAAQAGQAGTHADDITSYMNHMTEMMQKAGVSEQEFLAKLKSLPIFKAGKQAAKPFDETLGWDAWKSFPVENMHAAKVMAYYADAAHNATLDSVIAGHLGNLFGAVKDLDEAAYNAYRKAGYVPVNDTPSLQGILFPKEYTTRIQQLMDSVGPKGKRAEGFLKTYDKVLGLYKTGLTKYLPSHHVTNDIGQKYMAWLDGLTNPQWYKRAITIMAHNGAADSGVADAGRFILKTGSGHTLDETAVMKAFEDAGLRPSFAGIADLAGEEPKFKAMIPAAVDKFSQAREVHNRLAHFMFALNQEKGALPDAIQAAAMRVQKHHADYGDLTGFERNVMRRVIPFYTWQRKVAPTLVRQALMNPAKIMVYPKAQMAINQHFGITPEPGDPFPGLSMIPSFMMEGNQAVYSMSGHGKNPIVGGPRTPFDDVVGKAINHPVGNILDMLTPAIKAPYELKSGIAIGNSQIHVLNKNQDRATYLENNTPLLSVLMRITRRDPLHGFAPTRKAPDEQGTNIQALLNLLTAGGLKEDTSRYQGIAAKENTKK